MSVKYRSSRAENSSTQRLPATVSPESRQATFKTISVLLALPDRGRAAGCLQPPRESVTRGTLTERHVYRAQSRPERVRDLRNISRAKRWGQRRAPAQT